MQETPGRLSVTAPAYTVAGPLSGLRYVSRVLYSYDMFRKCCTILPLWLERSVDRDSQK